MLDPALVSLLICPVTGGSLQLLDDGSGLYCEKGKLLYPIKDSIPVLLPDSAQPYDLQKESAAILSASD